MKVTIDGRIYQAATAVRLIEEIKDLHWQADSTTDAEKYILIQSGMYYKLTGRVMNFPPEWDTEARAVAMFETIARMGAWVFDKGDGQ